MRKIYEQKWQKTKVAILISDKIEHEQKNVIIDLKKKQQIKDSSSEHPWDKRNKNWSLWHI